MPQAVTPKNIAEVKLYTKKYAQFKGVDFSTESTQVSELRSPYAQNLISDMAGFPEKRLGWRSLFQVDAPINGLFHCVFKSGRGVRFVHGGTKLYIWDDVGATEIFAGLQNERTNAFAHSGRLFVMDGAKYRAVTETESGGEGEKVYTYTVAEVAAGECFLPTTVIGAAAAGGGTVFESVNLLNPQRKNSMIGDALSHLFHLDSEELNSVDKVEVEKEAYTLSEQTWARSEKDEGTAVSFIVPAALTGEKIQLKVSGRTYTAVDKDGKNIAPTTLAADARAAYLLTKDMDTDGKFYLAKPFEYVAAKEATEGQAATPANAPTVAAAVEDNIYVLTNKTYLLDLEKGTVEFAIPPPEYEGGGGIDNVIITFTRVVEGYADRINKCRLFAFYGYSNDNRVFLAGNPDHPNHDWMSGTDDPTYFPDDGYTKVGADTSAIMGYLKQYDNLIIVKSSNEQDAEVFLRTAQMSTDGKKTVFPLKQGIKGVGAASRFAFATLRDDPLFLAREGVYAITGTNVTQERSIQSRSFYVDKRLTEEPNLENAVAAVWNGYYIVCVNGHCYVADSRQRSGNSLTEQYSYEWYYWVNVPARILLELEGELFFGTAEGKVCKFNTDIPTMRKYNDDGAAIEARWSTKMDSFDTIMRRKTLVKKGAGVMIRPYTRSSVDVLVATEQTHERLIKRDAMDIFTFEDIDFSRIDFNTMETPQVKPFNTKIKKFVLLQLIFENKVVNEGFGVYGAQVQYTVGGYVK